MIWFHQNFGIYRNFTHACKSPILFKKKKKKKTLPFSIVSKLNYFFNYLILTNCQKIISIKIISIKDVIQVIKNIL